MKINTKNDDSVSAIILTTILLTLFALSSIVPKTTIWVGLYLIVTAALFLPLVVILGRSLEDWLRNISKLQGSVLWAIIMLAIIVAWTVTGEFLPKPWGLAYLVSLFVGVVLGGLFMFDL